MSTIRHRTTGVSPAFQFYPKDFLSSTKVRRMSLAEVGAYTLLLSHCWLDGSLPTDHQQIARLLNIPHRQWIRMWTAILSECFIEKNGRLVNDRLDRERRKQAEYRAKQSVNGTKGGRPRKNPSLEFGLSESKAVKSSPISDLQSPISDLRSAKQEHVPVVDDEWATFVAAYPAQGRTLSRLASGLFFDARSSGVPFADMLAALGNHKQSEQWLLGKIPNLTKWLEERRWLQVLPPPKQAAASSRTAGNLAAAQRFVARRQGGEA